MLRTAIFPSHRTKYKQLNFKRNEKFGIFTQYLNRNSLRQAGAFLEREIKSNIGIYRLRQCSSITDGMHGKWKIWIQLPHVFKSKLAEVIYVTGHCTFVDMDVWNTYVSTKSLHSVEWLQNRRTWYEYLYAIFNSQNQWQNGWVSFFATTESLLINIFRWNRFEVGKLAWVEEWCKYSSARVSNEKS